MGGMVFLPPGCESAGWGQRTQSWSFRSGGGDCKRGVSVNLIQAIDYARKRRALVFGIVGRDGGYTNRNGDIVVVIPTVDASLVTPHSEAFQAVVWHCLVSHPKLQRQPTKW